MTVIKLAGVEVSRRLFAGEDVPEQMSSTA